jgi:hypothetical protein
VTWVRPLSGVDKAYSTATEASAQCIFTVLQSQSPITDNQDPKLLCPAAQGSPIYGEAWVNEGGLSHSASQRTQCHLILLVFFCSTYAFEFDAIPFFLFIFHYICFWSHFHKAIAQTKITELHLCFLLEVLQFQALH